MTQDLVSVFNLALSAVGTRARIASPAEETREAQICRQWYPSVRDTALRAANWASCRSVARLALQREASSDADWADGDPEPPWQYRYGLPADYLYPRWLSDYSSFALCVFNDITMLQANIENPILIYTKRQENPAVWDPDLYRAIALGLAASIALPLHGKADRANVMIQDANTLIIRAREATANENTMELDSVPDWLLARGVTVSSAYSKYVYQYGPLFSVGALG